jgi:hypothetical protein
MEYNIKQETTMHRYGTTYAGTIYTFISVKITACMLLFIQRPRFDLKKSKKLYDI